MGLGKSLSIITLVASNPAGEVLEATQIAPVSKSAMDSGLTTKATLLIMPLHRRSFHSATIFFILTLFMIVLETWDAQLKKSVDHSCLFLSCT